MLIASAALVIAMDAHGVAALSADPNSCARRQVMTAARASHSCAERGADCLDRVITG